MITGGGNHGPHDFRVYMAGCLGDDGVAGQAQLEIGEGIAQVLLAGQKILILGDRSEEHTSELQSRENLVCRLLPEKKKNNAQRSPATSRRLSRSPTAG